jgi:hypothetical protein
MPHMAVISQLPGLRRSLAAERNPLPAFHRGVDCAPESRRLSGRRSSPVGRQEASKVPFAGPGTPAALCASAR